VSSIRRVTDIMGEISSASDEQAAGVAQVGEAVAQMDQATQQNAALVEEMAAAASSLNSQAQELVQTVAVFKSDAPDPSHHPMRLGSPSRSMPYAGNKVQGTKPNRVAAKTSVPKPSSIKPIALLKTPAKPAAPKKAVPAGGDEDWETF
jgi:uncharacterized phage infection (PIP) family protein YhgE